MPKTDFNPIIIRTSHWRGRITQTHHILVVFRLSSHGAYSLMLFEEHNLNVSAKIINPHTSLFNAILNFKKWNKSFENGNCVLLGESFMSPDGYDLPQMIRESYRRELVKNFKNSVGGKSGLTWALIAPNFYRHYSLMRTLHKDGVFHAFGIALVSSGDTLFMVEISSKHNLPQGQTIGKYDIFGNQNLNTISIAPITTAFSPYMDTQFGCYQNLWNDNKLLAHLRRTDEGYEPFFALDNDGFYEHLLEFSAFCRVEKPVGELIPGFEYHYAGSNYFDAEKYRLHTDLGFIVADDNGNYVHLNYEEAMAHGFTQIVRAGQ